MDETKYLHKILQEELEGAKKYKMLFNSIDEGFCIIDVIFDADNKPVDYLFLEVNEAFKKQTGLYNVEGRNVREVAPETEESWYEIYGEIALTGKSMRFEREARAVNKFYSIYAFKIGEDESRKVAVLFNDISEHKKAEEELKESETRFRSLYENSYDAILLTMPDGSILAANSAAQKMYGMTEEEITKAGREGIVVKNEQLESAQKERAQKGKVTAELTSKRKDGSTFPVEVTSSLFTDADGTFKTSMFVKDLTERKKAEEALKENELKYRGLFENLPLTANLMRYVLNNEGEVVNWVFEDMNSKTQELLGNSKEELKGKSLMELMGRDHIAQFLPMVNEIRRTGKVATQESHFEAMDMYHITTFAPLTNELFLTLDQDITERKKVEQEKQKLLEEIQQAAEELEVSNEELQCTTKELHVSNEELKHHGDELLKVNQALRESEQRLRRFYESGLLGVIFWNMDGEIIDANDKFLEMVGYTREDLTAGRIDWVNMTPPEFQHLDDASMEELKATGVNKMPFEKEYIRKDGVHVPITVAGAMLDDARFNGVAFVLDITDRKKAEEEIQKNLKLLNGINKVFEEYLTCETVEDVVGKCLEVAEELTSSEFSFIGELNENGRLDDRAISPPGWEACTANPEKSLELLSNMEIVSYWGRTIKEEKSQIVNNPDADPDRRGVPEGHPPITSFLGVPLKQGGKTIGMIALANKKGGYTEEDKENIETLSVAFVEALMRKKAEIDVRKSRNNLELKVAERTAELDILIGELKRSNAELQQFAYVSSHDLQEPLRTIASFTQLLERRYKGKLDSDADEFMDYIVDAAKRMQQLINDLLEYSRVATQAKEFELVDVNEVLNTVLSNLKISIDEDNVEIIYDNLPTVNADSLQLVQLFQNLIGNAIKFRKPDEPSIINVSAHKNEEKNEYVFSVADNGIGMEPQYAERIFVIFQRLHTREVYSGTGIGLSVAKKIVERHGGHVWVESELGEGSTFYFTIPVIEAA